MSGMRDPLCVEESDQAGLGRQAVCAAPAMPVVAVVRSSRDRWGLRRAFHRAAVEIARRSATTGALSQLPWGEVNNGSAEAHTDDDRVDDAGHGQFLRQCADRKSTRLKSSN